MSTQSIMEKFEKGVYSLRRVPFVFEIENARVYVHKSGPYQDEVQCMNWHEERLLTPKLKGKSFGDYSLMIGVINTKHFESREKLDDLYSKRYQRYHPKHPFQNIERISFQEALKLLTVTISCNMDYYLSNLLEIDNDLGRKVTNLDVDYKDQMKYLEARLFYCQLVKIFGEEDEDKIPKDEAASSQLYRKTMTFKDFRVLHSSGNEKIATAIRGNFYLLFNYATS